MSPRNKGIEAHTIVHKKMAKGVGYGWGWVVMDKSGLSPHTGGDASPTRDHQEAKGPCTPLPLHPEELELGGAFRSMLTSRVAKKSSDRL